MKRVRNIYKNIETGRVIVSHEKLDSKQYELIRENGTTQMEEKEVKTKKKHGKQ